MGINEDAKYIFKKNDNHVVQAAPSSRSCWEPTS
jgi:hypothetical protein